MPYSDQQSHQLMAAALRRNGSSNALQNDSNNLSGLLDPEDFVMSNTSMSMHTQSMVQGAETDRVANVLKNSAVTFFEDSVVQYDRDQSGQQLEEGDEEETMIGRGNHEVVNRSVKPHSLWAAPGEADTPLLRREDLGGFIDINQRATAF